MSILLQCACLIQLSGFSQACVPISRNPLSIICARMNGFCGLIKLFSVFVCHRSVWSDGVSSAGGNDACTRRIHVITFQDLRCVLDINRSNRSYRMLHLHIETDLSQMCFVLEARITTACGVNHAYRVYRARTEGSHCDVMDERPYLQLRTGKFNYAKM